MDVIAMSAGGWVGWVIGAPVSMFTAYMVSAVGAGVGLYAWRKVQKRIMP